MKSLAHPEWPYVGTPREWRGFARKVELKPVDLGWIDWAYYGANVPDYPVYQKQNFGPDLD